MREDASIGKRMGISFIIRPQYRALLSEIFTVSKCTYTGFSPRQG